MSSSVILVAGPPCAGKTTYALAAMEDETDIIVDMELFILALTNGHHRYDRNLGMRLYALKCRESILWLNKNAPPQDVKNIWVTALKPKAEEREAFATEYGAKCLLINPGKKECLRRLKNDDSRPEDVREEIKAAIEKWYEEFTESDIDELLDDVGVEAMALTKQDRKRHWYKIESKADKSEVWIYDVIGEDFWSGEGITAKTFQKELAAIKAPQIDLHINSPGGSVFDGIAIYNLLKQHPANITTYIDGWAASIASVIALAGSRVIMAENAVMMVHSPMGGAYGNAREVRGFADVLDKIGGSMATAYISKTGRDDAEIQAMMDAETWMTADEAYQLGFVDEISGRLDMAACARFVAVVAKAGFKHIPDVLQAARELPSERDLERTLRDAGCSHKIAKAILASGYPEDLRDEGSDPVDQPEASVQREVEPVAPARKDRVSDILVRAEQMAPSKQLQP